MSKVFIVHRDKHTEYGRMVEILTRMLVEPIALPGEVTLSKTIIEAIEHHSDVSFAIVLLTGDDECIGSPGSLPKMRARQNVVFEAGFLMGKITRERVMLLYEEGVELPTDLKGIIYVPLSHTDEQLTLILHQTFLRLEIPHKLSMP